jgi:hypothetical protein
MTHYLNLSAGSRDERCYFITHSAVQFTGNSFAPKCVQYK